MIRTFSLFLLLFLASPLFSEVTAKLIRSSYLFSNINIDNELSPFSGINPTACLNKGAIVKILDEYETESMYGNILFIEISDGKNGYIEKSVVIPHEYSGTKFYTNEQIKNIAPNSILYFQYSGMDGLHFKDKNKKSIVLDNLENLRFVLNRKTENRYQNKHKNIIVKVVDEQTLRPLINAKLNGKEIDSDGYCYLKTTDLGKNFSLECKGYESKNVNINKRINLFFLSKFFIEEKMESNNTCTVKIDSSAKYSQIYFRNKNNFDIYTTDSQSIELPKGKYEIIYETAESGFYPIQQFVNLQNNFMKLSDILKNANYTRSNMAWRDVPKSANSNNTYKILFSKNNDIVSDVSSEKYELEFIDCGFNFYQNNKFIAGGYFIRNNENIRLHWNFGYGMIASLFSCGVVVSGKIRENIGTGIYEFEITEKNFEAKVADKINMPWLPDIFNKKNILFIEEKSYSQ